MACFEHLPFDTGCTELPRSALVTYHFASILLRESLSDILMAAGAMYSWGRAVTPQRAQEAFLPLVSDHPVGQEAYRHALKILCLCINGDDDGAANAGGTRRVQRPLYLTYNAFIAVLVLWAYAIGVSRLQGVKGSRTQPEQSLWRIQAGRLKLVDPAEQGAAAKGGEGGKVAALGRVLERWFAKPEIGAEAIKEIKGDVREMMRMVREMLEGSAWELCEFLHSLWV
jgi:hypothetical protein